MVDKDFLIQNQSYIENRESGVYSSISELSGLNKKYQIELEELKLMLDAEVQLSERGEVAPLFNKCNFI